MFFSGNKTPDQPFGAKLKNNKTCLRIHPNKVTDLFFDITLYNHSNRWWYEAPKIKFRRKLHLLTVTSKMYWSSNNCKMQNIHGRLQF